MSISVVIPCYNCQDTIANTLNSVLAQAGDDVEIVCVNDGSTDKTGNVLSGFGSKITYVEQQNSGVSRTRNNGVSHASGDWIAFCDADDIWHKNKLAYLRRAIIEAQNQSVDFIFHDFFLIYNNEILEQRATHSRYTFFPVFTQWNITIPQILVNHKSINLDDPKLEWAKMDLYSGNPFYWLIMGNFVLPSSVAMRREVFLRENGFTNEFTHAEDTEFFLRISKKVDFMYIDLPLVGYRRTSTSLLSRSMLPTMENGIRSIIKNCVNDKEVYTKYKKRIDTSLARKYARLGYFHITEMKNRNARDAAKKSLSYNPFERVAWTVIFMSFFPVSLLQYFRKLKSVMR